MEHSDYLPRMGEVLGLNCKTEKKNRQQKLNMITSYKLPGLYLVRCTALILLFYVRLVPPEGYLFLAICMLRLSIQGFCILGKIEIFKIKSIYCKYLKKLKFIFVVTVPKDKLPLYVSHANVWSWEFYLIFEWQSRVWTPCFKNIIWTGNTTL